MIWLVTTSAEVRESKWEMAIRVLKKCDILLHNIAKHLVAVLILDPRERIGDWNALVSVGPLAGTGVIEFEYEDSFDSLLKPRPSLPVKAYLVLGESNFDDGQVLSILFGKDSSVRCLCRTLGHS